MDLVDLRPLGEEGSEHEGEESHAGLSPALLVHVEVSEPPSTS